MEERGLSAVRKCCYCAWRCKKYVIVARGLQLKINGDYKLLIMEHVLIRKE